MLSFSSGTEIFSFSPSSARFFRFEGAEFPNAHDNSDNNNSVFVSRVQNYRTDLCNYGDGIAVAFGRRLFRPCRCRKRDTESWGVYRSGGA